ncbi:MAG: Fic family protein [Oscillospiraceae bacterium]|nr:Fic family protein [Oscillospiraceae bacterium]
MGLILKQNKIAEACRSRFNAANLPLVEEENVDIIALSRSRQFFYLNFREEFTYDSNAIEGNKITLPETYEILRKNVTISGKPLKDQMEIIGHAKAFDYLVETATNKKLPLSDDLILTVHKMTLKNSENPAGNKSAGGSRSIAGRYRTFGEDVVVGDPVTGEVFHRGASPMSLSDNIKGLIDDYNHLVSDSSINIIGLLAGFHLCFESIHPFCDGNGRVGRLLVNFELIKHNYLPIDIRFAERAAYYAAFEKKADESVSDDYTRMTELFVRSMLSSQAMYKRLHEQYASGNAERAPVYQVRTMPADS